MVPNCFSKKDRHLTNEPTEYNIPTRGSGQGTGVSVEKLCFLNLRDAFYEVGGGLVRVVSIDRSYKPLHFRIIFNFFK